MKGLEKTVNTKVLFVGIFGAMLVLSACGGGGSSTDNTIDNSSDNANTECGESRFFELSPSGLCQTKHDLSQEPSHILHRYYDLFVSRVYSRGTDASDASGNSFPYREGPFDTNTLPTVVDEAIRSGSYAVLGHTLHGENEKPLYSPEAIREYCPDYKDIPVEDVYLNLDNFFETTKEYLIEGLPDNLSNVPNTSDYGNAIFESIKFPNGGFIGSWHIRELHREDLANGIWNFLEEENVEYDNYPEHATWGYRAICTSKDDKSQNIAWFYKTYILEGENHPASAFVFGQKVRSPYYETDFRRDVDDITGEEFVNYSYNINAYASLNELIETSIYHVGTNEIYGPVYKEVAKIGGVYNSWALSHFDKVDSKLDCSVSSDKRAVECGGRRIGSLSDASTDTEKMLLLTLVYKGYRRHNLTNLQTDCVVNELEKRCLTW